MPLLKQNRRLIVIAGYAAMMVIVSAFLSNAVWGYWFSPPAVTNVTAPFATVSGYAPFQFDLDGDILRAEGEMQFGQYPLMLDRNSWRAVNTLTGDAPGTMDDFGTIDIGYLSAIADYLTSLDVQPLAELRALENAPSRFDPAGYLVEGTDVNGDPLLLMTLSLYHPNNDDSYEQIETLFSVDGTTLIALESQNWRYDIAGIEGFDFSVFVPVLSIVLSPVLLFALYKARPRMLTVGMSPGA